MTAYHIALVEDDSLIRRMVKLNLEQNGHRVSSFVEGESVLEELEREMFDLFVLDIQLPGISGLEVLGEVRRRGINTPVLMLTVQAAVRDKIRALDGGADDYLAKPFNMEELLARVNALIRRSTGGRAIPSSQVLVIDDFSINLSTRECRSNKGEIILSEREIKLLAFFSRNVGKTLTRADILEEVWGMDVSPTPRTVDNFVLKFRKLFERYPDNPCHFISVRNKGYRFEK